MNGPTDDELDDVLAQVEAALDALNIQDPSSRDLVLDGVRDALDDLGADGLPPSVKVFEGGRMEGSAPRDATPELHLVEPEPIEEAIPDGDEPIPLPRMRVRVVRSGGSTSNPSKDSEGAIALPGTGQYPEWQTIVHGTRPRLYRLRCTEGALQLAVDGDLVARLDAGQCTDLEGSVVRVGAATEGACQGTYRWLGDA